MIKIDPTTLYNRYLETRISNLRAFSFPDITNTNITQDN